MTKREAIIEAMKAKLVGLPQVSPLSVYRSRVEALSRAQVPSVNIEPLQETADNELIHTVDWTLTVRVTVFVRGQIPDQLADPIVEKIHENLSQDLSLGGLAMDVRILSINFDLIEGDLPIGVIAMDYQVLYRTSVTSLST